MAVQILVIGYVLYQSYQGRVDLIKSARADCELKKKDRTDNADFQRAQRDYIKSVTGAKSVKEDVKKAARKAIVTFDRTSTSLTVRSKVSCNKAFPDPTLFPSAVSAQP